MSALAFIVVVVVLCWVYDFFNGMNDAANAIATVVASGTLTPGQAIALARSLNLVGAFLTTRVAYTVGQGIVPPGMVSDRFLIAGLLGAIAWTAFCTFMGLPISITHSLVGGLVGPTLVLSRTELVNMTGLISIAAGMIFAPILGFVAGYGLMWLVQRLLRHARQSALRYGQLASASFMALTHGANDTQNAMGIITAALVVGGYLSEFTVPLWVKIGSALFMALGTWAGGWRVIDTLGRRLVEVDVSRGFAAETSASIVIASVTVLGIPISTTHVISSAILGTGAEKSLDDINWSVAGEIALAWLLTIPGSAIAAAMTFLVLT